MSNISDWFKARESRRYTVTSRTKSSDFPDGVWQKCPGCKSIVYQGELDGPRQVCTKCGHHFPLSAPERIGQLADEGSFQQLDPDLTSVDPLGFCAGKSYAASLESAKEKTGLPEAILTGRASIGGHPVVLGVMDFRFIGASMGSAVGEKVARAFEVALAEGRGVVMVTASGGARMQESTLSLMQMAKTAAAAERVSAAGLPFLAVLTNPTYGGVTASFPVLADVILAEPGALVGFSGPRVIEQTIRQSLPKGFQTAEFMERHGMVDAVVPRAELPARLALLLDYLMPEDGGVREGCRDLSADGGEA